MKAVGIRELKNKLSEYLRDVRRGEVVLVTDRGTVIAEIGPPGKTTWTHPPGLQALAAQGRARLPLIPNDPSAYPRMPRAGRPGLAKELLDAEREDR